MIAEILWFIILLGPWKKFRTRLIARCPPKNWKIIGQAGRVLTSGKASRDLLPHDFFMYTFPIKHFQVIVRLTNERMESSGDHVVTPGETLKVFGMLVLMTKYIVGSRRDL